MYVYTQVYINIYMHLNIQILVHTHTLYIYIYTLFGESFEFYGISILISNVMLNPAYIKYNL